MRIETERFTATWTPDVPLGDFGQLTIERPKHPPLHVIGTLRPRGDEGLRVKAEHFLKGEQHV